MNVIFKIKYFIGNTFHIRQWSDNYNRNISNEALNDAYIYVVTKHRELYNKLNDYYKGRNIAIPLKKYDINLIPKIKITNSKQLVPHKIMAYDEACFTIYVHHSMLYLNPIEYRSLLVHEVIHHVYHCILLSYGGIRWTFKNNAIGIYEQDPEEFVADYWRLFYEGYDENSILKYLSEWYFKNDTITYDIIIRLQNWGYIPTHKCP